ncbi:MAG TPA: hypothetical protein ENK44_14575 [Caldithrix abyssi]|uniref:DUF481 domain-containing protein n=1 Tax=Caldithrix abyssi TaxID=187145 RepID=A0A7V4WW79_CALAY|nr:hypothetical protein [Caldithrix abyssi]
MRLSFIFPLIFICILPLIAQPADEYQNVAVGDTVRIVTNDGSEFIGKIKEKNDLYLYLVTLSNLDIKIPAESIESIVKVSGQIKSGAYWHDDPNNTRLFLGPTGRTLKKGRGYFSAYEIFFPTFGYGISDYISLAGGVTLIPGSSTQVVYINPQFRIYRSGQFAVAAGVNLLTTTGFDDLEPLVNLAATYGDEKSALTAAMVVPISDGEEINDPIFMVGGEVRVSQSIKLISENWFSVQGEDPVLSAGVRFFGKSLAADLGFFYLTGASISGFPFLPWIGFAYNF